MRYISIVFFFFFSLAVVSLATVYFFSQSRSNTPLLLQKDTVTAQTDRDTLIEPALSVTPSPEPNSVTILFGGDVMLDRHIRQHAASKGYSYILEDFADLIDQSDLFLINLEGPITTYPSRSIGSEVGSSNNYIFTFEPKVTEFLREHKMTVVNLGNNHILNFGKEGLHQTEEFLTNSGIEYFGYTGASGSAYLQKDINGVSFGFVNYNQFIPGGYEQALDDIKSVSDSSEFVIVHPHWGNEYQPTAGPVIQEQAHAFIDAGADVIFGAHPHVVQQTEIYNGKTIYYSLGNFIFDQYFEPAVRQGKVVQTVFTSGSDQLHFQEYETQLQPDGSTALLRSIVE